MFGESDNSVYTVEISWDARSLAC